MPRAARWTLILFALAGAGFAGAATWVHYKLLTDSSYVSPCDVSSTFSCSQAYLSTYGSVWGVPTALAGLFWFVLVALVAGLAPAPDRRSPTSAVTYLTGLTAIGLGTITYLAYASFAVLHVWCPLCLGTYVSVLGIAAGTALAWRAPGRAPARLVADAKFVLEHPRWRIAAIAYVSAAVLLVVFFPRGIRIGATPAASASDRRTFEEQFRDAWAGQHRYDLGVPAGGAKVVVVKFNDWMCPGCKAEQAFYQPVLDRFNASNPGAVTLVIRDWLWNSDCNPYVQKTFLGHEASCVAAAAVRMAAARHKGDAMGAWIFANQESLAALSMGGKLDQAAAMIKQQLTTLVGAVDYDREYPRVLSAIQHDEADGQALGVFSTPTYFVNGVRTTADRSNPKTAGNNLAPNLFELAIRIELERALGEGASPTLQ